MASSALRTVLAPPCSLTVLTAISFRPFATGRIYTHVSNGRVGAEPDDVPESSCAVCKDRLRTRLGHTSHASAERP